MGNLAITNQGNTYKRTDAAKVALPTLMAGGIAAGMASEVVREHKFYNKFKDKLTFVDHSIYRQKGESILKYAKRFLFGEGGKPALAEVKWGKLGLVIAAAIGVGAIVDGVINKIKAHVADRK